MRHRSHRIERVARWLLAVLGLALVALAGCGGGGDGPPPMEGSTESRAITSRVNGSTYPLSIYLPPAGAGSRATLPIVYALDGDWWFTQLVDIAEAAGSHAFSAYLASDSSVGCMPATADTWEAAYAAASTELAVRLHMSHASINNFDIAFAQRIRDRRYGQLVATEQTYPGTHTGIIPAAFADALRFAFAP